MDLADLLTSEDSRGFDLHNDWYLKMLKDRTIVLNDECTEEILERVVLPLLSFEKDDSDEPITLLVQTGGGATFPSWIVTDIIDNYSKPLIIRGMGYCLSMGFYILAAGKNNPNVIREAYPHTIGMLHNGSVNLSGESGTVKDTQKFLEKLEEIERQWLLEHTDLDEDTLEKWDRKEMYLTSDELLEYNIIDRLVGDTDGEEE